MKHLRIVCAAIAFAALAVGCSGGTSGNVDAASPTPMSLQGVVHGGQAPIVGATVTLYAASQQPLFAAALVTATSTDANGNFSFSNATCPSPTSQMYVTSTGGNPGGGVNSAIHLMAILGPCNSLHQSVTVNELTTVAAAYTANRFIGPSGCADCTGGAPDSVDNISGNATGVVNAMGNAALLVSTFSGLAAPSLPTAADCAAASPAANCLTVRRLNTLGDALAACVNSSGPTSSQCVQLFSCTTPGAAYVNTTSCTAPAGATLPTDTLRAVLNVARNPAMVSTNGLYETCARDVVFSPIIVNGVPPEFTLSLNIAGTGFSNPFTIAIDASGNVWVTNYNSTTVTELSPNGTALSDVGFAGAGFTVGANPVGIAIDASDNVWVANAGSASVDVLDQSGNLILGSPITTGGLSNPSGVAIAPSGNVWVVDFSSPGKVSEFNSGGTPNGTGFAVGNGPIFLAIDAGGYVWVANKNDNTVTELNPAGTLVATTAAAYGGLSAPYGIAVDPFGNVWTANGGNASVTKLTVGQEAVVSGTEFTGGGLSGPQAIASDAAGNIWVANIGNGRNVTELSPSGVALSPSTGFIGPIVSTPYGIAIDPSGNVWVGNAQSGNSVTVFFGAAAPTRTPLVSALTHGFVL